MESSPRSASVGEKGSAFCSVTYQLATHEKCFLGGDTDISLNHLSNVTSSVTFGRTSRLGEMAYLLILFTSSSEKDST